MKKMKVSIVVGTRPNLIKLGPLSKALAKDKAFETQVINTGQHYDYELDGIFKDELGLSKMVFLGIGSGSHAEQIGNALIRIERELAKFRPDAVLVIGDTNSTLAGALAAAKMGIPLGHIEAGLRSFDRRMPEEGNRVIVDHLSDMLFAPTKTAVRNLRAEGIYDKKIFLTYDISVDACLGNYEVAKRSDVLKKLGVSDDFVLVTLHRPANVDSKKTVSAILDSLAEVSKSRQVVFPIHPRTSKRLEEFGLLRKHSKSIKFVKPQGYFEFLKLLGSASCVVTDSGGVQKEALILKTPCVTVRDTTEWPETVKLGGNVLVGQDKSRIRKEILIRSAGDFRKKIKKVKNPFGDGKTSERIISILKERAR